MMLEGSNMKTPSLDSLPIAVIGGGPVGLAAAAHLIARNLPAKVYEAGPAVGANMRDWGHVRVFTPWRYCTDAAAVVLLDAPAGRRLRPTTSRRVARSSRAISNHSPRRPNCLV
jgi:2-polyprenyl-6-methoxyphenol hydroxylase-like FAD-dependent oxidoreductase